MEKRKSLIRQFKPYTFISAERGEEQKKDFSYINKYEANFILSLLDYICQLIYKNITGNEIEYLDSADEAKEPKNEE